MTYPNSTITFEQMLLKFMSEQDPMLAMLQWLCEQMMEAEVSAKIQARKSERTKERTGYRSGYRVRRFDTRMGTMYLFVPKLRKGGYVPFFVTEKSRAETALIQVIQEAYVQGVSTRKIRKLARRLGIASISRSQVSQITQELNEQVEAFRNRPLKETYPVLWVDALYEKIRDGHRVSTWLFKWSSASMNKVNGISWPSSPCRKSRRPPTKLCLIISNPEASGMFGWLYRMLIRVCPKPSVNRLSAVPGNGAKST